jgi:hypothetical protein
VTVKNTRANFSLIDEAPTRLPDRISPLQLNHAKEPIYSYYWDEPELGGMTRQSNHYGSTNIAIWSLEGPGGFVASPTEFKMFLNDNMQTGFIRYSDMGPIIEYSNFLKK